MSAHKRIFSVFALYRGLPRSLYVLFVATIINGAGIFVFPFLTLFLTKKLGMDAGTAGEFLFFTTLAYLPGAYLGGKLADRYGRKIVAAGAQALSLACYIPCGFLVSAPPELAGIAIPALVLMAMAFHGFADPAYGAIYTDLTTPANRQAAFSLGYLGHNLGFALGPLIAGFLFNSAPAWLFWGNAAAGLIAVSLLAAFVPETKPSAEFVQRSLEGGDAHDKAHSGNLIQALLSRPSLLAFTGIGALMALVYGQHRFALPLQTEAVLGASGAALYGSLMSVNALCVILFTAPLIAALKRFGPVRNTAFAALFYAVGFGSLAFARCPLAFFATTVVWSLGEIVNATNAEVYVANRTPVSHRGRFNAVLPLVGMLGGALSAPLGGSVLSAFGWLPLWLLIGAIAVLAALGFLVLEAAESRNRVRTAAAGE